MDNEDFRQMVDVWGTHLRNRNLSKDTQRAYLSGAIQFAEWCERQGIDPDLTMANAEAFTASYIDAGRSASTATLRQLSIRRLSAWAVDNDEEGFEQDPLAKLKAPRLDQKVVDALTPEQFRALLTQCEGKRFVDIRDNALVRFMTGTTARADEVTAMRTFDVDIAANSAVIIRGKGGKGRRVGYDDKTAAAVGRYLRVRRRHPLAGSDWLWLAEGSRVLSYQALYQTLRRRAVRAGIKQFHPHQLRHTAAVRWLGAGGTPLGLKAQGGWRDYAMIERYLGAAAETLAIEEAKRLKHDD